MYRKYAVSTYSPGDSSVICIIAQFFKKDDIDSTFAITG